MRLGESERCNRTLYDGLNGVQPSTVKSLKKERFVFTVISLRKLTRRGSVMSKEFEPSSVK